MGADRDDHDRQPAHRPRLLHPGRRHLRLGRHARDRPERRRPDDRPADRGRHRRSRSFVSAHPSASCITNPSAATGLQHDVEAAPKGDAILNAANPFAVRTDTQLLIDASDADGPLPRPGRARARGDASRAGSRSSTSPTSRTRSRSGSPATSASRTRSTSTRSARTSPTRSTSDAVTRRRRTATARRTRIRETSSDALRPRRLRGRRLLLLPELPAGSQVDAKRAACQPEGLPLPLPDRRDGARAHAQGGLGVYGCHELEVYPDDRLTCGSGNALIALDMSGAFDDMGTPTDYSDDKPRGTPLPCKERPSSSAPAVRDRRDGDRLRRRHQRRPRGRRRRGHRGPDDPGLDRAGLALARGRRATSAASTTRAAAPAARRPRRSTRPRTSPSTTRPSSPARAST